MPTSRVVPKPEEPELRLLVDFYSPVTRGPDSQGRYFQDILSWSDSKIESVHDFIQFLFPTTEASRFNTNAPVINEQAFLYIRQNYNIQNNMKLALERMLRFYGFDVVWEPDVTTGKERVIVTNKHPVDFSRWLQKDNHNHLRITRIIRSLRIFGLRTEAKAVHRAFYEAWSNGNRLVPRTTIILWMNAALNPLAVSPDGIIRTPWLQKYS